jgi:aldehyde dehydrogenase (NAD+)
MLYFVTMIQHQIFDQLGTMKAGMLSGPFTTSEQRIDLLKKIKTAILNHEEPLFKALYQDLRKGREEAWVTEIGMTIAEIDQAIRKLEKWMRPKRVSTNLLNFPSSSYLYPEPLGVVLIIAPWNYPFMLLMAPMVGAIAAGNKVVIKPSENAPATEQVIGDIIDSIPDQKDILYVKGNGAEVVPALMNGFRFDHVFFTGGTLVGKKIYEMAARQLIPVTLELGGKSPCVVEEDANFKVAARRITLGKFSNAGQICIAPDYLLVHQSKREEMVQEIIACIKSFYGEKADLSKEYCRIINRNQFLRLKGYLHYEEIIYGGHTNEADLFIEPTLVAIKDLDSRIMEEEIFGPILPVISFRTKEEALSVIQRHPNPLAFYVFTGNKQKEEDWIRTVPAGTGCVNNVTWQFTNPALPFGGRGNSGIGAAHGKHSFDRFTHYKSVLKTPTWFDPLMKYPPLSGKLNLFKKIIG